MGRASQVRAFGEGVQASAPGLCVSWVYRCPCEQGSHETDPFPLTSDSFIGAALEAANRNGWALAIERAR